MTLRLSIENLDRLPDGGPLRIEVKGRGLDLGRDAHLDWTLPDPSRTVSSKHCEIRFRDGGYWLHDVSTNGTFVNGSPYRLDAPYLLHDGDRLSIGPYIIAVSVEGRQGPGRSQASAAPAAPAGDVWETVEEAAAPDDRAAYQVQKPQARSPDFLDFAASIEPANPLVPPAGTPPAVDAWLTPPAAPPPRAETTAQPLPSPRRPAPPQPPPEAAPAGVALPAAGAQSQAAAADAALLARIARAAGIPERAIAGRDPNALADEIGLSIRLTAQNLAQMLSSRAEFEDAHAVVEPHDGPRAREQPAQVHDFGRRRAGDHVRGADAPVPRRAGDDREQLLRPQDPSGPHLRRDARRARRLVRGSRARKDRPFGGARPWARSDRRFPQGEIVGYLCRTLARQNQTG